MNFKKPISVLLALVIVLSLLPAITLPVDAQTGYDRGYAGGMAGSGEYKAFGLDVSSYQGISLDFNMIKNAGYDYVILRAGTSKGKDTCFETYYANAKAAGLDVGAYYYSYATSVAAVQSDMNAFISYIDGKTFEYPIYFDYEDASQQALSASLSQEICLTAMDMLAAKGYLVGLYTGKYFSTQLPMDVICAKYEVWIAHYLASGGNNYDGTGDYWKYGPTYASQYGMYQFTDSVWIDGCGPFDGDVCYKDYPAIVKAYGFNGYNTGKDPVGYVDGVTVVGPGKIRVRGWTLDEDDLTTPLEVHVYVGGGPGDPNAEGHIIKADQIRDDIGVAYPGAGSAHGFDVILNTGKSGNQVVNIFGINVAAGSNTLLNNSGVTVDIPLDTEQPTISDVRVTDVTALGYTVTCTVSDNVAIQKVMMPTWTQAWDQDDIIWGEATITGNQASINISFSSHNFEYGTYNTHIYAYDLAGNYVTYPVIIEVPPVLANTPVSGTVGENNYFISSVMNKNFVVDVSAASMDNNANAQLFFTVGTAKNQMWHISDPDGDGYYTIISLHSGKALEAAAAGTTDGTNVQQYEVNGTDAQLWKLEHLGDGLYRIVNKHSGLVLDLDDGTVANGQNIQLYTANDTWAQLWYLIPADLTGPQISNVQFSEITTEGFRVTCNVSDITGIEKVQFPAWTKYNGTDDQLWYDATIIGNTATCYISTSNHNYAPGDYEVHIYAYDTLGNSYAVIGGDVTVPNRIGNTSVSGQLNGGTYFITTSQNQNFVVDVEGVSVENGANVYLWETFGTGRNQMWQISDPDGDGYYTIVSLHSGKYLDVEGGVAASDTNVQQYEFTNSAAQLWQIVPNEDGTYCFYSMCGGFALDLFYGWVGNGINIRIHDVNGAPAQKWYLIPAKLSADTTHTHTYATSVVTAPTCTEAGYTTHTCANCGESYTSDHVGATGHNYVETVVDATCITPGVKTFTCSGCSHSYTEEIPALGHNYVDGVCSGCGKVDQTTCKHSYTYTFVEDTSHTFVCEICDKTVTGAAVAGEKKFAISSAAPVLNEDIVIKFNVRVPSGFTDVYAVFNFHGEDFRCEATSNGSTYVFPFDKVCPMYVGDNISTTIYATFEGEEVAIAKETYSMREYAQRQLSKTTLDAGIRTILSDLLVYAEKAQNYFGWNTENPVTKDLESMMTPSSFVKPGEDAYKLALTGTKDANVDFVSATLMLQSKLVVRYTIATTDPSAYTYKLQVAGRTYTYTGEDLVPIEGEDGRYYLYFNVLKAAQFNETITASFYQGDTLVGRTVTYSVNTYIYKNVDAASGDLKALLEAIYNYGQAAWAIT